MPEIKAMKLSRVTVAMDEPAFFASVANNYKVGGLPVCELGRDAD